MHFHRGVVHRLRRRPRTGAGTPALPSTASRPELPRVVGQVPAVALVDEIEAGNIRALFVTGGNPLTAFPQPARLEAALATLDVLAVVDVAENPLTEIATHVLPATGQLERADITLARADRARGPACRRRGRSSSRAPTADRSGGCSPRLSRAMRPARRPAASTRTRSATRTTSVASSRTRGSTPTTCSRPDRAASTRPSSTAGSHDELLADGRWSIAPAPLLERLAAYADPAPARVRARAAAGDGVEQLGRVRRGRDRARRA